MKQWILYKLILWGIKKPDIVIKDWFNATVIIKGITNFRYVKEIWIKRIKKFIKENPNSLKIVVVDERGKKLL